MERVASQVLTGQVVQALVAPDPDSMVSVAQSQVQVMFEGFEGDRHAGLTRSSGGRESAYPRGTEIRNQRPVSIVAEEELASVAEALGVPSVEAATLGANLLLRGIPALTLLPPGTHLYFERGAALVVQEENFPCELAGSALQACYPDIPGLATAFPRAAMHLRGVVGWVERPGVIMPGDSVRVTVPEQVVYRVPNLQERQT